MRKVLGLVGALAFAGCAESVMQEQRDAQMHQQRANIAAANGDYARAAREQEKANDKVRDADRKLYEEEHANQPAPLAPTPLSQPPVSNPQVPPSGMPY